jgi:hypothetical protein
LETTLKNPIGDPQLQNEMANMSSKKRNGVRNLRTKETVVDILKAHPKGLATFQIGEEMEKSSKGRFCKPGNRQLGLIVRGIRGVEMSEEKFYARCLITDAMKEHNVWVLVDEQKFIEWKERKIQ